MNVRDLTQAMAEMRDLHTLIQPTVAGGDARWQALQSWIERNPRWQPIVAAIVDLEPAEALNEIGRQLDLNLHVIAQLFPEAAAKAEGVISELQTLYKQRSHSK